jgi:predicted Fe-S protein YdhL (DUF1289 family)
MTDRWVSRNTLKQIIDLQKGSYGGIAASVLECVGAYRLFDAIECWLTGDTAKAQVLANKVDPSQFTDLPMLLAINERQKARVAGGDAFTRTCVSAHQQLVDWTRLTTGTDEATMQKIKERHERYRAMQEVTVDA